MSAFDPLIHQRRDGLREWAMLTASCLAMRPRFTVEECDAMIDRLQRMQAGGRVESNTARNLLADLWVMRDFARLRRTASLLKSLEIGSAWGLPDAYLEAIGGVVPPLRL